MTKQSAAAAKANPMRNINRMDDDSRRTHAWLVRVQRHSHIAMKMFSDGVWGGKRKALAAARLGVSVASRDTAPYEAARVSVINPWEM